MTQYYDLPSKSAAGIAAIADLINANSDLKQILQNSKERPPMFLLRCNYFTRMNSPTTAAGWCCQTNTINPDCTRCSVWSLQKHHFNDSKTWEEEKKVCPL